MSKPIIVLKRAYEKPSKNDGYRILVDRLWPRGISKEHAKINAWLKEIAPTTELRKWFNHDPKKWAVFQKRYAQELKSIPEVVQELRNLLDKHPHVTFVYAAKDKEHNNAIALQKLLKR